MGGDSQLQHTHSRSGSEINCPGNVRVRLSWTIDDRQSIFHTHLPLVPLHPAIVVEVDAVQREPCPVAGEAAEVRLEVGVVERLERHARVLVRLVLVVYVVAEAGLRLLEQPGMERKNNQPAMHRTAAVSKQPG
eukprot:SAG22_NODE_2244_length_2796_cov_2.378198_2_plen_134_part_00